MSKNFGYVCLSHDPHLSSEAWFNWGQDVLRDAWERERAGVWPEVRVAGEHGWDEPVPVHGSHESSAPIYWLREHPHCEVGLEDEYGEVTPLGETVRVGQPSLPMLAQHP